MHKPRLITCLVLFLFVSVLRATAQEDYYSPLIREVVVVAKVTALQDTGALEVRFDEGQKELWLATIRLPNSESIARESAEELLHERLVGKSMEIHVLGSGYGGEKKWVGYALDDGVDVRLELVSKGLARYCRGSQRDPEFELRDREARQTRRGMWSNKQKGAVPGCEGAA